MCANLISSSTADLSAQQRRIRRHAGQLGFKAAVRFAAKSSFGFTHRLPQGESLWSDSVGAWLGNATFIHWSMDEIHIDIPRIVAGTDGAPDDASEFHKAVRAELTDYWLACLASLPPKSTPKWMPLP
jgi:hypothetical protein